VTSLPDAAKLAEMEAVGDSAHPLHPALLKNNPLGVFFSAFWRFLMTFAQPLDPELSAGQPWRRLTPLSCPLGACLGSKVCRRIIH